MATLKSDQANICDSKLLSYSMNLVQAQIKCLPIKAKTKGQSNLTKSVSRGAHSPVRVHSRGSKVVPLNSWGRVSY